MDSKLFKIKNLVWAIAIAVALLAVVIGIFIVMFKRYNGETSNYKLDLGKAEGQDLVEIGEGAGVSRGELKLLKETEMADDSYLDNLYFLVDSTFIDLRNQSLVNPDHVWGAPNDSLPIGSVTTANIRFKDGSEISVANAALISKPDILFIGIGSDGLADVTEEQFVQQYDTLIRDIRSASADTVIVCLGLASITDDYSSPDGLTITMMSDGNDWVQYVCRDTGAFYLDIGDPIQASAALLSRYAAANGKTLNKAGLTEVLNLIKTHEIVIIK